MGWFIVYLLMIVINAICLLSANIDTKDPRYWISIACVWLAYFAGLQHG